MPSEAIAKNTLRSLFDNAHTFVSLRDTQGRYLEVNRAIAELFGAAPGDIVGRTVFDLCGPEASQVFEDDQTVVRNGAPLVNITEILPRQGDHSRLARACKLPVCDERGTVTGILSIAFDDAEAANPPQSHHDNANLLEKLFESVAVPIAFFGREHRLTFANRAYWVLHDDLDTHGVAKIGAHYEDIVRAMCEHAQDCENGAARQVLADRLIEEHRNPGTGALISQNGRSYHHQFYRTPCDGRALLIVDTTEQRHTGHGVAEHRDLLHTLVENFSEALVLYGPDDRLRFGNRTYWKFHADAGTADVIKVGATREENAQAMARRLGERNDAFNVETVLDDIERMHQGKASGISFAWGDRDVSLRHYPIQEGGWVTFAQDITERKNAEEALEASNARLRHFAESASDWFWETDADLRYTWISQRIADATGEAAELIYGRKRSDLIDTTVDPEAWEEHQETIRQRKPFRDFVYRRDPASLPDGHDEVLWVRTSGVPVFQSDGTFVGYRGTGSNVTPETLAEQELKESERRFQTLAESAPVGIFQTTTDGICIYHNEVWRTIAGAKSDGGIGALWTTVFQADDRQRITADWQERALEDGVYRTEGRIARHGCDDLWVLATIAVDECPDRGPCTFVGTLTDISQFKRAEAQLRAAEQNLREHRDELEDLVERRTAALRKAQQNLIAKERLSAIGQLTATVSHELRNPLGTISTSFTVLRKHIELPTDKAVAIVERIERNISRCETIIRDLLNYTRIDSLDCKVLDLDTWMIQFLAEQELPSSITLETNLCANSAVCIDRTRMTQALDNIISNAVDAMADNTASHSVLEITSDRHGEECVIVICDDGPGIDPSNSDQVFEPLVSTKAFGVGLGLPLVRQIVELHGGHVAIRNREERGAEVTIRIPIHKKSQCMKNASPTLEGDCIAEGER